MARPNRNVMQYIRELFGPQGNGILENGDIRVAIDIERDDNNVPVGVQIRHIHPVQGQPGALLQPPPMIDEFWADGSAELVNHILARDLLQPDFYGIAQNNIDLDRMDEDDDDLPPGVRDRRHSPKRVVRRKSKSPKRKVVRKSKSPKKRVVRKSKSPKKRLVRKSKSPKKRVVKRKSPKKRVVKRKSPKKSPVKSQMSIVELYMYIKDIPLTLPTKNEFVKQIVKYRNLSPELEKVVKRVENAPELTHHLMVKVMEELLEVILVDPNLKEELRVAEN